MIYERCDGKTSRFENIRGVAVQGDAGILQEVSWRDSTPSAVRNRRAAALQAEKEAAKLINKGACLKGKKAGK